MKWTQIRVKTTEEASGAIENYLFENGAIGIEIKSNEQDGTDPDRLTLLAYFPSDSLSKARFRNLHGFIQQLPTFGIHADVDLTMRTIADENWSENWRSAFPPQKITENIIVAPTWHRLELEEDQTVVRLDPGMAFGTGHHPTTRLSIILIEEMIQNGDVVADVGTGSGILAILAAKLGAEKVIATDIDRTAVSIAQNNSLYNQVDQIVKVHQMDRFSELDQIETEIFSFDLIVINILTKVIIPIIPQCRSKLKPSGRFILSGITASESVKVTAELKANGFQISKVRQMDEWIAIVAELKPRE